MLRYHEEILYARDQLILILCLVIGEKKCECRLERVSFCGASDLMEDDPAMAQ
jgi:hypothetical protein